MRSNTTSAGMPKIPTSAALMKPRIDRLSTTRPKKPLRSPATNQRGLACVWVLVVMGSLSRGCPARPRPPFGPLLPLRRRRAWGRPLACAAGEGSGRGHGSELRGEIHADRPRFVDEPGQVVEVDAADDARGVGDVAAEQRHLVVTVAPAVADAQAALERGLAAELDRLVQEEVDLAAVRPVGVDEELAVVAHRHAPARGEVVHPLGRLRQLVAVDDEQAGTGRG